MFSHQSISVRIIFQVHENRHFSTGKKVTLYREMLNIVDIFTCHMPHAIYLIYL